MQYQVLARKWRPKKFKDVIGQDHITRSLKNALVGQKVGHAYLFTGSRGTGKTSVARIFAKSLRCSQLSSEGDSCNECKSCLDFNTSNPLNVLEIDGASNNSVENVRDLISEVGYLPSEGKYKIYIIDEVHMLSVSAFNALLKTLEEPPAHVVFILATTEPQKLPTTVLSRCQRFDFKMVQTSDLVKHLQNIAQNEGINFTSNKLIEDICIRGKGSVRDTLSLMDQVLCYTENKQVDENVLVTSLGLARDSVISELVDELLVGDMTKVSSLFRSMIHENISVQNIVSALIDKLYSFINSTKELRDVSKAELFWIFETIARDSKWALESLDPEKVIEIVLQKVAARRDFFTKKAVLKKTEVKKEEINQEDLKNFHQEIDEDVAYSPLDSMDDEKVQAISNPIGEIKEEKKTPKSIKTWSEFLNFLQKKSPSTFSNLEQGNLLEEVDLDSNILEVHYGFSMESKVFYDFLVEIKDKICGFMGEFFERDPQSIHLVFKINEDEDFKSQADLRRMSEEELHKEKEDDLLSHQAIKHAESIFNTKIDKTILN